MPAIMLVDQDATRLQALMSSLKTNKLEINPAESGAAAWRSIQAQAPNLIICSAAPPAEDSLQLCKRVKLSGQGVPFVAYAPAEDEVLRLMFLESGADDFVTADALTELLGAMTADEKAEAKGSTATAQTRQQQQMFFRLRTGELGNVLQFLGFSQRTGRLEISVDTKHAEKANIAIVRGEVVHAEYTGFVGVDAIAMLLSRGDAEAYFFDDQEMAGSEISMQLSQLLIEATVLSDEIRDAQNAFDNLDLYVQRTVAEMPDDLDPDMTAAWNLVDGNCTVKEIFSELGLGELRAKRALKKLQDAQAIRVTTAAEAGVTPRSRAESLFRRFCQRLETVASPEASNSLLAHLSTLARRSVAPEDFMNVVMLNFPPAVKVVHAACRCDCGGQAFLVDGSEVECRRCGTPMVVRSSASYSLKVDSIAREQGGS